MRLFLALVFAAAPLSAQADPSAAIDAWRANWEARAAAVESRCLSRAASAPSSYEDKDVYTFDGGTVFQEDPGNLFEVAQQNVGKAKIVQAVDGLTHPASGWWGLLETAAAEIFDPKLTKENAVLLAKSDDAQSAAYRRYQGLRDKAVKAAAGLTDAQKAALASCVSANSLSYDGVEADQIRTGRRDALKAALYPWESFATDITDEREYGKGVCRDYAAIAADFLKAMGVTSRGVVSGGHTMTEVTLSDAGGLRRLLEPQWDMMNAHEFQLFHYPGETTFPARAPVDGRDTAGDKAALDQNAAAAARMGLIAPQ